MRASTSGKSIGPIADPVDFTDNSSAPIVDLDSHGPHLPGQDPLLGNVSNDAIDHIDHTVSVDALNGFDASNGNFSSGIVPTGHDLGSAPVDAMLATGGEITHLSTSDEGLWDNNGAGSANPTATPDGSDFSAAVPSPTSELSVNTIDAGANADSFGANSSGIVPDVGEASDTVGGTLSTANSVGNIQVLTDASANSSAEPSAYVPPPSEPAPAGSQSEAPILAFTGDLGSGVGELAPVSSSTGSGTGSSGSGTVDQTSGASAGLVIDIDWDSSVSNAPAGFVTAVDQVVSYYESQFSNPITITIDVGYGEIDGSTVGSNDLGESESYLTSVSYSQLESALVKNADAIGDTAAAASLTATSPVNGEYWMTTAEAQALGISGASASVNGYVGFSSTLPFAYNNSSGVPAGQYDFFGAVAHEISEVMGRQMMDGASFLGVTGYEPLDLFHYSAPGVRDFSATTAGYFSANGGVTNLGNFNTNPDGDFGDMGRKRRSKFIPGVL